MDKQDLIIGALAVTSAGFSVYMLTKDNSAANTMPSAKSIDQEWITWYDALKSTYGAKRARVLWLARWNNTAVKKDTTVNTPSLREYMQDKAKITIEASGILGTLQEWNDDIGDAIGSVLGVGKYIAIGGVILIGVPVFMLLFNVARRPERVVYAATAGASPVGKMKL